MNYRIAAPDGIWTHKIVVTHLGGDAYLTVTLTQVNLKEPIVVESADLDRKSLNLKHHVPVPVGNVEVIDHRGETKAKPSLFTDVYRRNEDFE